MAERISDAKLAMMLAMDPESPIYLDLRDARSRLADVEKERDRALALGNDDGDLLVDARLALAAEQARTKALREALEWLRANPCCGAFTTAERSTGEAVVCGNCPHNAALVAEALSVPSSQDALREFGERVAVATSIAVGLPGALMVPGNSAAAIVASVLKEVGK